uniref:hypothetical protein n=1 Tax=Candidatus Ichthyocystis hellenicum TaxID=1561003 RepID=UPI001584F9DD
VAERHTSSNNIPVSACDEINVIRAPVWTPPVFDEEDILPSSVEPSKVSLLPSVGHSGAGSSFDPSAAKRHIGSDSVSVGMPPVLDDDLPSSTVSIPSYLQCTDSLGVNLHPDSAILVHGLFYSIRIFCTASFSRSVSRYISNMLVSELSAVERVICFKTYRELHLSAFISRCLCMYHSRYRPTFIRALANIRVLSGSSDHGLTSLNGVNLVDFLSKLDCAIRDLVWSVFNSRWAVETGKACSELACGLLNDVSCKDLIRVLGVADVPVASFSVFRKYMMNKSKTSVSSSKITAVGTDSGSGITGHEPLPPERRFKSKKQLGSSLLLEEDYGSSSDKSSSNIIDDALVSTGDSACSEFVALVGGSTTATSHSPSISLPTPASSYPSTSGPHSQSKTQLGSLLLLEESSDQSPRFVALFSYRDQSGSVSTAGTGPTFVGSPEGTGSSLPFVTRSVSESNVSSESLLTVSDAVLVPTADDTVPNLEVSGDELSASSSLPSFEWEQVPIFPPFLQHHWLEKLD